jgi:hypothetical protein
MEADPDDPRCKCGKQLLAPESIRRGTCTGCFLRGKKEGGQH